MGTFAPFGLAPTGYLPSYQTVRKVGRSEIAFFANISEDAAQALATGTTGQLS